MNDRVSDAATAARAVRTVTISPLEDSHGSSPLEEFVAIASRLNASISDLPIFADHGIGPATWALLRALKAGPLSTDELAQQAGLSRQRVRIQVKELEAKHFLVVARQDEGDRRARIVQIAPLGALALEQISNWLEARSQDGNNKRFTAAIKQMRLLQRMFLQEKRLRQREAKLQKSSRGNASPASFEP